ncbi:gtp-binding protein engb [Agrilactobacillus composti DSM 18527 = JCM 14202]|uniref:Probable GTP-binding protein EngB n=1 Tax=Agrilactobacillus composti DSM 18527 = JCM 14202 TaxID=1423734 RepID=A0A0R1YC89_9LACO|nr:ribosome biogenesis GTP-binding protein YihA/YsxC [Agrilactobacillus composti]KRM36588.1 gtp-binding protein engb [Agrilactobacillus composti DSM 18527 = JCM 14202]
MQFSDIKLVISAVDPKQYPTDGLPEIALSGRSNVGKSSLINTLLSRKGLARTSSTPGKTQTLNFYNIANRLYFVDVPGYGYAKVSKKQREQFGHIIETYLQTRKQMKGVVLLVDARHAPTSDDVSMYNYLKYYEVPTLVVATKVDKIKRGQRVKQTKLIISALDMDPNDELIFFSSETKEGHDAVWRWIEQRSQLTILDETKS